MTDKRPTSDPARPSFLMGARVGHQRQTRLVTRDIGVNLSVLVGAPAGQVTDNETTAPNTLAHIGARFPRPCANAAKHKGLASRDKGKRGTSQKPWTGERKMIRAELVDGG
ncbi:uncharacterized protein GLRG_10879 [Colletotrichum graminicola M1.001]|uniref:Uncharacterized protein n=1 Tax=Colletotrichum graminicola (strain M1.001 / M2 / FGSC 10212) TaxID=645133 RepID=E3QXY7_COLGM|nr:uncharacterized protein GLRG_10879 [Colletotrichum graminicola M1.001]EFQ35724.1 hypothetical protein GLRG_10879 [Colletotrichum graminicola M1.001]